ncbi:MAG: SDR family NAD(P)-dependent oxidoreductase [Kiloniellales bacterium]
MARRTTPPRSILITGASSGIGAALARHYAASGCHLALGGRNAERLAAASTAARQAGAEVESKALDVREAGPLADWIGAVDRKQPLELVIANAGISAGTGGGEEGAEQVRRIFAVNLDGVLNSVLPAVDAMRRRRRGQIAIMSSLAAFRGFPGAPAYSASKAAVRVWGEALRAHLRAEGIAVSVICPGFVESPMTAVNDFPMPLLLPVDKAAAIIARGLARRKPVIAFPWPLYLGARLASALPAGLADRLLAKLPAKN